MVLEAVTLMVVGREQETFIDTALFVCCTFRVPTEGLKLVAVALVVVGREQGTFRSTALFVCSTFRVPTEGLKLVAVALVVVGREHRTLRSTAIAIKIINIVQVYNKGPSDKRAGTVLVLVFLDLFSLQVCSFIFIIWADDNAS